LIEVDCNFLPVQVSGDVVIVVDVLRMTTTASVLFDRGLEELYVAADPDDAGRIASERKALLIGERGGVKLPDFNGGNSPNEYLALDLTGKLAVMCTSNGSRAVESSLDSDTLLLGSINNAAAVARHALAPSSGQITLVCAGTGGRVSFDDVVASAVILQELEKAALQLEYSDAAKDLGTVASGDCDSDIEEKLSSARHVATLKRLGFVADISFASEVNRSSAGPHVSAGKPAHISCLISLVPEAQLLSKTSTRCSSSVGRATL
jgi:2-phosphosulfolactate phosphatase